MPGTLWLYLSYIRYIKPPRLLWSSEVCFSKFRTRCEKEDVLFFRVYGNLNKLSSGLSDIFFRLWRPRSQESLSEQYVNNVGSIPLQVAADTNFVAPADNQDIRIWSG